MVALPTPPASSLLDNGQPAISCFLLTQAEVVRRLNLAHERAEAQAKAENAHSDEALHIAKFTLWHTDFPNGLLLLVCDSELFRLTADLPSELLRANGGQQLDLWDYSYVADLLRDWLTSRTLPGDLQNLRRALAWAEQQGSTKRDYALE